jgi:phosphatidylserine decarboxylase
MTIHKEGYKIIATALVILIALNLIFVWAFAALPLLYSILGIASLIFFILVVSFFRIPKRTVTINDNHILAPSDGKVVVIEEVEETEFLKEKCTQISIFMSPLNVHCQWFPVNGEVSYTKYHTGSYLVAWHPKSSTENERNTIAVKATNGQSIVFRQIAGAVARRIVCFTKAGETAKQDKQAGFIKFGSRIDVFIPLSANIKVNLEEKVQGNQTILAEFN